MLGSSGNTEGLLGVARRAARELRKQQIVGAAENGNSSVGAKLDLEWAWDGAPVGWSLGQGPPEGRCWGFQDLAGVVIGSLIWGRRVATPQVAGEQPPY